MTTIISNYNLYRLIWKTAMQIIRYSLGTFASEYLLNTTLIKRINEERALCIKDYFVLVEFHFFSNPIDLYEMLFELKSKEYKIIIAHPERYLYFHNDFRKLTKLKAFGVYF